jgi:hypothetical protein
MAARAALNSAAHERSSMAGFGLPALFTAFVRLGGEPDEGGDLLSGQAAELRQVGDQRRGHDGADAAHPAQSLGEAIKLPIAGDVALDRLLDGLKALGQRRDDSRQAFPHDRIVRQIGAAAFRGGSEMATVFEDQSTIGAPAGVPILNQRWDPNNAIHAARPR